MILTDTKNDEDKGIPLPPFALNSSESIRTGISTKILPTLDLDTCLLFPSQNLEDTRHIYENVATDTQEMSRTFRIITSHDNRHTFASHFVMNGAQFDRYLSIRPIRFQLPEFQAARRD